MEFSKPVANKGNVLWDLESQSSCQTKTLGSLSTVLRCLAMFPQQKDETWTKTLEMFGLAFWETFVLDLNGRFWGFCFT